MAIQEYSTHATRRGDLEEAFRSYLRMRKLTGTMQEVVLPTYVSPASDETVELWGALVQHRPESHAGILEY
uniref:Uncharacterized protein n=1 Tax=Leersia perrieri TaxID=77586 RepID=A0A0D9V989_9ORYZ